MLDHLNALDTTVFLFLNSKHNVVFDFIMYWASNKLIWIPYYILLLDIIYKHIGKKVILVFVLAITMVALSDQLSSNLIKNLVERPRPSHVEAIAGQVHLVNDYKGGPYGFVSSHASNAFALALFLLAIVPKKLKGTRISLWCYAILISYSRIYLGVHYPGDVLGGLILAMLLSFLFILIYHKFENRFNSTVVNNESKAG